MQIEVASRADADFVYALCSEVVKTVLPALLDRLFSDAVPSNQHLRIPKLELQLGTFDKQSIKSELPRKLVQQLQRNLQPYAQGAAQRRTLLEQTQGEWESVQYFLNRGQLPWWESNKTTFNLSKIIQRSGQSEQATQLFRQRMQQLKPAAWQRLFLQLPPTTAREMLQRSAAKLTSAQQSLTELWLAHFSQIFPAYSKKRAALQAAILQLSLSNSLSLAQWQKQFYQTLAQLTNGSEKTLRRQFQRSLYQRQLTAQPSTQDRAVLLTLLVNEQSNPYQNVRLFLQFGLLPPTETGKTVEEFTAFIRQRAAQKDRSLRANVLPLLRQKSVRQRVFNQCVPATQIALISLYFPQHSPTEITALFQSLGGWASKNNFTTSPEHFRTFLQHLSLNWLATRSSKQQLQLTDLLAFLLEKIAQRHYQTEEEFQQDSADLLNFSDLVHLKPSVINLKFTKSRRFSKLLPTTTFQTRSSNSDVTFTPLSKFNKGTTTNLPRPQIEAVPNDFITQIAYFLKHGFWQNETPPDLAIVENKLLELAEKANPVLQRLLKKVFTDATQTTRFLEQFSAATWRVALDVIRPQTAEYAAWQQRLLAIFKVHPQQAVMSLRVERAVYRQLLTWAIQPSLTHSTWAGIDLMEAVAESLALATTDLLKFVQQADYQHFTAVNYLLQLTTLEQFSKGSLTTQRELRQQMTTFIAQRDPVFYQAVKERTNETPFVKHLIQYVPQDLIEALFFLLWKGKSLDMQREYGTFKTAFLQLYPNYTLAWFETLFAAWRQVYPALDFKQFWSLWLQALAQRTQTNFENFIRSILTTAPYKKIRETNILAQILSETATQTAQLPPPITEAIEQFFNPSVHLKNESLIDVPAYLREQVARTHPDKKLLPLLKKMFRRRNVFQQLIHQQSSEVLAHLAQLLAGKNWRTIQQQLAKKMPTDSAAAFAEMLREREERLWHLAVIELFVQQSGMQLPTDWQQQIEQKATAIPEQIHQQIEALALGNIPAAEPPIAVNSSPQSSSSTPVFKIPKELSPTTNPTTNIDFLLVLNDYFKFDQLPLWSPFTTHQYLEQHLLFTFKTDPVPLKNYLTRWLSTPSFRMWLLQQFSETVIEKISAVFQAELSPTVQQQLTRLSWQWQLIDSHPRAEVKAFFQQTFLNYYFSRALNAPFSIAEFQTQLLQHFAYQTRATVRALATKIHWLPKVAINASEREPTTVTAMVILEEWAYWCRFQRLMPTSVFRSVSEMEQQLPFHDQQAAEALRRIFLREIHQLAKLEWWFANVQLPTVTQLSQLFLQQQPLEVQLAIKRLLPADSSTAVVMQGAMDTHTFWWLFLKIIITQPAENAFSLLDFQQAISRGDFPSPRELPRVLLPQTKSQRDGKSHRDEDAATSRGDFPSPLELPRVLSSQTKSQRDGKSHRDEDAATSGDDFPSPRDLSAKSAVIHLIKTVKHQQNTTSNTTAQWTVLEQQILDNWAAIATDIELANQLIEIWQHIDCQIFIKQNLSQPFIKKISQLSIQTLSKNKDEITAIVSSDNSDHQPTSSSSITIIDPILSTKIIDQIQHFNQLQRFLTEGVATDIFLTKIDVFVQSFVQQSPARLVRMLRKLPPQSNLVPRLRTHLQNGTLLEVLQVFTQRIHRFSFNQLQRDTLRIAQVFNRPKREIWEILTELLLSKPHWQLPRIVREIIQNISHQTTENAVISATSLNQLAQLSLTPLVQKVVLKWRAEIEQVATIPSAAVMIADPIAAPPAGLDKEAVALFHLLQTNRRAWWDTNTQPLPKRWNQWVQQSPKNALQILSSLSSTQRRTWLKWLTLETTQRIQPQLLPSVKTWLPELITALEPHWQGEIKVSVWTKIVTKAVLRYVLETLPSAQKLVKSAGDLKSPADVDLAPLVKSIMTALGATAAQQKAVLQTLERALQQQWAQWKKEVQAQLNHVEIKQLLENAKYRIPPRYPILQSGSADSLSAAATFTQFQKSSKRESSRALTMTDLIKIELTALRYFLQRGHLQPSAEQLSKSELEEQLLYHLQKHPDLVRAVLADCFQTAESIERFLQFFSEKAQRKVLEVWAADVPLWSFLATLQQLFSAADSQYPQAARRQTQVFFLLNYLAENAALPSDTTAFVEKWLRYLARQEQLSYVDLLTRLLQPIQSGQLQLEGKLMPHLLKLEEGSRTTATERRAAKIQEQTKVAAAELVKLPDEGVVIHNAGLVILASFFYRYFKMLELLDGRKFKDEDAAIRAVHLLQYLVNQQTENAEHLLVFNKILCGVPLATPVPLSIEMTEQEVTVSDQMYHSILANWPKMESTSIENLRASFIIRNGLLVEKEDKWTLQVEPAPYDILLEFLPWTISVITLPWVEKRIEVTWKTRN